VKLRLEATVYTYHVAKDSLATRGARIKHTLATSSPQATQPPRRTATQPPRRTPALSAVAADNNCKIQPLIARLTTQGCRC
jgi:hypothetical protein